jgi:outer membrane protein OmpA-like peptidoglycan-associated protein
MRAPATVGLVVALLSGAVPAVAQAPVLVDAEAAFAAPVTSPQTERFGWGGRVAVGVRAPILPWLVPTARLHVSILADGARPSDPNLADPGVGSLGRLSLGLMFRLSGILEPASVRRGDGGWLELSIGGALTGALVRPAFEAGLGWAFVLGPVELGPVFRVEHVVHFDDPLDSSGAVLLSLGAQVVLLDEEPPPPVEPEPEVDADRDGDGIVDRLDGCPDDPEDFDGDRDEDGCPDEDSDRDGDGIVDRLDACPDEPEDPDGHADEDGCPDLDDDGDGILLPEDQCPLDPETINGVDDEDGCPDEGLITMVEGRIVLDERVLFELNRSRVRHAARPTLTAIVELWRQHPEWTRVRVEGHADERGTDEVNLELSTRRAERVVEALVELGMPAELLSFVGYGAERPRDTRGTEEAMEANRRVEFVVVETREEAVAE